MDRTRARLTLATALGWLWIGVALSGCASTVAIRVENVSSYDFTEVRVGGQRYGDIEAGETSDYESVRLKLRYTALELWVEGRHMTGQTLNLGAGRFTYRIGVEDYEARRLAIDLERE